MAANTSWLRAEGVPVLPLMKPTSSAVNNFEVGEKSTLASLETYGWGLSSPSATIAWCRAPRMTLSFLACRWFRRYRLGRGRGGTGRCREAHRLASRLGLVRFVGWDAAPPRCDRGGAALRGRADTVSGWSGLTVLASTTSGRSKPESGFW